MNELIKIRDVSAKYDISARTLRYYEDMGLLTSTRSDDYAYRLYDEDAVKRLEQILILRRLNVSIKDIKRVFDAPGSEAVLEVLDKKVSDIDDEVALLHELKDIILNFIRQIEQSDFGKESDVKLLYEKAREIETQLVNVDYDGNAANVNRLLEVTEQLGKKPDIVKRPPRFYQMFHIDDPVGASKLYVEAFGAVITSGDYLPNGDPYINIEIDGYPILLRPHDNEHYHGDCCVRFSSQEELRRAFEVMIRNGGHGELLVDWHWTPLSALLHDNHGVGWMFCC
ncbi:MAG: MerR family transcriptional regulator [Christensenellales bacterium]|jgi:DNA-binding transcriptional MerR regulator